MARASVNGVRGSAIQHHGQLLSSSPRCSSLTLSGPAAGAAAAAVAVAVQPGPPPPALRFPDTLYSLLLSHKWVNKSNGPLGLAGKRPGQTRHIEGEGVRGNHLSTLMKHSLLRGVVGHDEHLADRRLGRRPLLCLHAPTASFPTHQIVIQQQGRANAPLTPGLAAGGRTGGS